MPLRPGERRRGRNEAETNTPMPMANDKGTDEEPEDPDFIKGAAHVQLAGAARRRGFVDRSDSDGARAREVVLQVERKKRGSTTASDLGCRQVSACRFRGWERSCSSS